MGPIIAVAIRRAVKDIVITKKMTVVTGPHSRYWGGFDLSD